MRQIPLNIALDDSAHFNNFFVGSNSQVFHRISSENNDEQSFLYLWGPNASGKSHLAQALCRKYTDNGLSAFYFPLDTPSLTPQLLQGLESSDLVCLDNLEFIVGNEAWERAVFNLFNDIKHLNHELLLVSHYSAKNIPIALPDLASRLNSMEVYRLNAVSHDDYADFVAFCASQRGLKIAKDVTEFMLARTERNPSKLIELIALLDKQSLTEQRRITIPFVKNILSI
jgi:DnaA family protein